MTSTAWPFGVNACRGAIFATVSCRTAGRYNSGSREEGGSTEELGQSTDVTYVEINSPGL